MSNDDISFRSQGHGQSGAPSELADREQETPYSVYIIHAVPDKVLATAIYQWLRDRGIETFLDSESLRPGDGLKMPKAVETATIALFILSPDFVARKWTMQELVVFLQRASVAAETGNPGPYLLPVFYRLSVHDVRDPNLFNREDEYGRLIYSENGFFKRLEEGDSSIEQAQNALKGIGMFVGIENWEEVTNSQINADRRHPLVQRIVSGVEDVLKRRQEAQRTTPDPRIVEAALAQGKDKLDTVRLMVRGASIRGKTSTIASLRGQKFDDDRDSTRGIDLSICHLMFGRRNLDDRERSYLEQKDKFQARFRLFYSQNTLLKVVAGSRSTVESQHVVVDIQSTVDEIAGHILDGGLPGGTENEFANESVI